MVCRPIATTGMEIRNSLPNSSLALPLRVLAISPTRSRFAASSRRSSLKDLKILNSIELFAVKQTAPRVLPDTPMMPVYSRKGSARSLINGGFHYQGQVRIDRFEVPPGAGDENLNIGVVHFL